MAESIGFTCRATQQSTNPVSPYVNQYGSCFYTDETASPSCSAVPTAQMSVCCCGNSSDACPTFNGGLFGGLYPESDTYTLVAAGDVPGNNNVRRLTDGTSPINGTYLGVDAVSECADLCDETAFCTSFVIFGENTTYGQALAPPTLACSLLNTTDYSLTEIIGEASISFVRSSLLMLAA